MILEPRQHASRPRLLSLDDEQVARRVISHSGLHGPDLEDALQDVRLRLLRSAPPDQHLTPWVARVANNVAIDHHRATQRRRNLVARLAATANPWATTPQPAERLAVAGGLRHLRPDHRDVLVLRFLAGLSLREVAAVLDVPEGTVKSRLHRASAALRMVLDENKELSWTA